MAVASSGRRTGASGGMAAVRPVPARGRASTSGGGAMTFEHPWVLVLLLAPLVWAWFEWRSSGRRLGLAFKAAAFAAILLALAQPKITVYESKVAVAVLADTSASLSPADLRQES